MALAQPQAQLEVNSEKIGLNEQLTVTITVTGESSMNSEGTPDLTNLQGFRLVSGPNTSSQFQWINGRTSSSLSYSYVLLPIKAGRYTLGPFSFSSGASKLKTNPVTVEVTADSGGQSPPRQGGRRPNSAFPPGWPSMEEDRRETAADPGDDVFVAVEPTRSQAYPGQRIDLTYRLYTRYSISSLVLKEAPALKGFWVEDIKVPEQPVGEQRIMRGKTYTAFVVKKQSVYPNTPGKLTLPSSIFSMDIRTRGNNPFSFFNLGSTETIFRRTEPMEITVLPFPDSGKPADFQNLAGQFQLRAKTDKTEAKVGEAVAWTLTLAGNGNLNTLADLPLPAMPNFQLFSSKSRIQSGGVESAKTWDLVLIPQTQGAQVVPGVELSYFDPEEQHYRKTRTEPIALRIAGGSANTASASALMLPAQQRLTRQGSDINFIKLSSGRLESNPAGGPGSLLLLSFFMVPLLTNALLWWHRIAAEKAAGDSPLHRRRRAASKALESLRLAEKSVSTSSAADGFYAHLGEAFSLFLSERFALPIIDLTREQVEEKLLSIGVSADLVQGTLQMMDHGDFARFAPAAVKTGDAGETLWKMRELIRNLDRHESE